jgi:Uma2 family endonuclease
MDPKFLRADELGIRLEIVAGLPIWEAYPLYRHQKAVGRIRATIKPAPSRPIERACVHASAVYVSFPDGSLKRPDIAIFCREPDEEDEAITLIPEAVIEVISKGYEAKDLEIGPHFYLSQGGQRRRSLRPVHLDGAARPAHRGHASGVAGRLFSRMRLYMHGIGSRQP